MERGQKQSENTNQNNQAVFNRLSQDAFLIVNKNIMQIFGADMALVLGNLIDKYKYFYTRKMDESGWFFLTEEEQSLQIGITPHRLRIAKNYWKTLGILQMKKKGLPARIWYKLDMDNIIDLLNKLDNKADFAPSYQYFKKLPSKYREVVLKILRTILYKENKGNNNKGKERTSAPNGKPVNGKNNKQSNQSNNKQSNQSNNKQSNQSKQDTPLKLFKTYLPDNLAKNKKVLHALKEFIQYRKEDKRNSITKRSIVKLCNIIIKEKYTPQEICQGVDTTISSGWIGLFITKTNAVNNKGKRNDVKATYELSKSLAKAIDEGQGSPEYIPK